MPQPWTDPHPADLEAADLAACRTLLRSGSRSFDAAARLLPASVRDPAIALYAFCRVADDAIDCDGGDRLAGLQERLALAYAGRPVPLPADRAFARVVARFAIPRAVPEALLEGFAWDAEGRRYADLPALRAYAVRVAGTVGAMMAVLMGVRDPRRLAAAVDLGVAMQLSNIARDVGEDARAGRLYLPLQWLTEAGIDPDGFLAEPRHSLALGAVVRRLLDVADVHYRRAAAGIVRLPLACRFGIGAACLLYAEIGRQVARRGFDAVSGRAVVSGRRKAWVLSTGLPGMALPPRLLFGPPMQKGVLSKGRCLPDSTFLPKDAYLPEGCFPKDSFPKGIVLRESAVLPEGAFLPKGAFLPEGAFLIDAVSQTTVRPPVPRLAWWNVAERMRWVLDLFERLEQRQRVRT